MNALDGYRAPNSPKLVALAFFLVFAVSPLTVSADKGYYEYVEVPAADPGPAPDTSDLRMIIGGTLLSAAAVAFGLLTLLGRSQSLDRRWKWSVGACVIALGLLVAAVLTLRSKSYADYKAWRAEREAFDRGDTVKEEIYFPPNSNRYDSKEYSAPTVGNGGRS